MGFGQTTDGHTNMVKLMRGREDVAPEVIEKMLCENPARFYALGA